MQEYLAVPLGFEPRITEHDHAEIVEIANQTAHPLFQCQHGLRQLVLDKWIAAAAANALQTRLEQRILRGGKGQLVDGDDRQRVAFHIDTFPKACRGEQHRIAQFPELMQQRFARRLALHQHRKRRLRKSGVKCFDSVGQAAITGVEQKCPSAAGLEQGRNGRDELHRELRMLRFRHVAR